MRIEYTNSALHRWIAHVLLIVVAGGSAVSVGARDYAIWTFGNTPTTAAWTSHKTDDLSSWKSVDCMSFGPDFLVSGLIGYKEPWSNLDNFIARLDVTCTQFDRVTAHTRTVFSSKNHRDAAYALDIFDWDAHQDLSCPAYYFVGPVGQVGMIGAMEVGTDPNGDYIQNFRFFGRCARLKDDHTIDWASVGDANQMISDRGYEMYDRAGLHCPGQDYVVTAIELRFDTGKGKIRDLRVHCRQLMFRYLP